MKKRIKCPKCDEPILFDDSQYAPGRTLVFECPACNKQFRLRIPSQRTSDDAADKPTEPLGTLIVIENDFHLKQEIPLYEGDNVIGRHVPGTKANAAIKTVDPSVDTTHCIINAHRDSRSGLTRFVIRDANSSTGTFVQTDILQPRDRVIIADGTIITIGATTMILRS